MYIHTQNIHIAICTYVWSVAENMSASLKNKIIFNHKNIKLEIRFKKGLGPDSKIKPERIVEMCTLYGHPE